jgi:hypothetical protein
MTLHVIDHHPAAWFLLGDRERAPEECFLDVRCSSANGLSEFSLLVQLSETEHEEHRALGRVAIEYLAAKIAYWPDRYRDRDLTASLGSAVHEAVMAFKQTHGSAGQAPTDG